MFEFREEQKELVSEDSPNTFVKQFEQEMNANSPSTLHAEIKDFPTETTSDQNTDEQELYSFFDTLKTNSDSVQYFSIATEMLLFK